MQIRSFFARGLTLWMKALDLGYSIFKPSSKSATAHKAVSLDRPVKFEDNNTGIRCLYARVAAKGNLAFGSPLTTAYQQHIKYQMW